MRPELGRNSLRRDATTTANRLLGDPCNGLQQLVGRVADAYFTGKLPANDLLLVDDERNWVRNAGSWTLRVLVEDTVGLNRLTAFIGQQWKLNFPYFGKSSQYFLRIVANRNHLCLRRGNLLKILLQLN